MQTLNSGPENEQRFTEETSPCRSHPFILSPWNQIVRVVAVFAARRVRCRKPNAWSVDDLIPFLAKFVFHIESIFHIFLRHVEVLP